MGQFSWIYSDTNKQVVDNKHADTYLLVPPPFQSQYGKAIYESCYDGYGHFGGYDVYELIAEWNREFLSKEMLRDEPKLENYSGLWNFEKDRMRRDGLSEDAIEKKDFEQKNHYYQLALADYKRTIRMLADYKNGMSEDKMIEKYGNDWRRYIGVDIACYDEQNARLPYPIKITSKEMNYESVKPSESDPNQGWED